MMIRPDQINPHINFLVDLAESTGKLKPLLDYNNRHIKNRTCSNCEKKVDLNKDLDRIIVRKEYFISGLCNECQPYFFLEKEAI